MSRENLSTFGGAMLATEPKLLADGIGVDSRNHKPGRGDLRPWKQPLAVYTVPSGTKTVYRMGRDVASDTLYWLTWNTVVHAIHGFISGDTTERTYYTGSGTPKQTNNVIGLTGGPPYPTGFRELGVPVPASAPVITPLTPGVSDVTEYRYYVYTYVTDWGDESAPSPVSLEVICKSDATLTISNIEVPPAGAYGINRVRIYRTATGTAGDTEFFFLREEVATIGTTTDDGRALGEVLPTDGWLPTPPTLTWLTGMWNGMAAGIIPGDGSVRYCVAYKPYAWPIAQETLPPNAKARALGVFGQRLVIVTDGNPVLVTGSSPDSLDEQPLEMNQACMSPLSTVGLGHGVAWAAPDGLAYLGESGPKIVTAGILTREQWQAMRPETMTGTSFEGAYFGSYLDAGDVRRGFFIDCVSPNGIFFLDQGFETMYQDASRDALFVLDGTSLKKWDAGASLMTARYRSKVFTGVPRNFSAARVEAEAYPVTMVFDALEMPQDAIDAAIVEYPGLLTNPSAGVLRHTSTVTSREPFRMPGQFSSRLHQFEVQSATPVQWVAIATSVGELVE